jgi:hypothetical protein
MALLALHTPQSHNSRSPRRRGIASLLAMLYLIIFAALALGFYAQTNVAAQVSDNERRKKEALMAAETGLQFIRYELSRITLDPKLTDDQTFEEMHMDLQAQLDGSGTLEGGTIGYPVYDPAMIKPPRFEIPGDPKQYIKVGESGPWFRVRVEQQGRELVVTTIGKSGSDAASSSGVRAGIEVHFGTREWPNKFFDYGIASQGQVIVESRNIIELGDPPPQASILSTYEGLNPVSIGNVLSTSPAGIAGDITVVEGYPPLFLGPVSIGGTTNMVDILANHVHTIKPTAKPEFPVPDTQIYRDLAVNKYDPLKTTHDNIWIPGGTNPTFKAGHLVRGVVYVYQPNIVKFEGTVTMQCVVVTDPLGANDLTKNIIQFTGNGGIKEPLSALPNEPQFDEIRKLTGTFVLAPGFDVLFTGNFGSTVGHVAGDRITITGSASADINGSLITLKANPIRIGGNAALTLKASTAPHSGLRFTERFTPLKSSYREIAPRD